eukprot:scaffold441705_cov51-Prasinocladus_malaysianus.AAC.1
MQPATYHPQGALSLTPIQPQSGPVHWSLGDESPTEGAQEGSPVENNVNCSPDERVSGTPGVEFVPDTPGMEMSPF